MYCSRDRQTLSIEIGWQTYLVVLQVQIGIDDILAGALGHVAPAELWIFECIPSVLPLSGLRAAQALRRSACVRVSQRDS